MKDIPLGIDLLNKGKKNLNKKLIFNILFRITIQIPNLYSLI